MNPGAFSKETLAGPVHVFKQRSRDRGLAHGAGHQDDLSRPSDCPRYGRALAETPAQMTPQRVQQSIRPFLPDWHPCRPPNRVEFRWVPSGVQDAKTALSGGQKDAYGA